MGVNIRLAGLWPLLRAKLDTDALALATGGKDRILTPPGPLYVERTDAEQGTAWGRLVILPMASLWPAEDRDWEPRPLAFLVRAEFNDIDAKTVDYGIEAAHSEAYQALNGWLADPWPGGRMVQAVWREVPPPPVSGYDTQRSLWVSPAEYRCLVAP